MEEIKKPTRVEVPLKPLLEKFSDKLLIKDLCEGEEVCPTCGGLNLVIRDNPFGLGEKDKEMFPYKRQGMVIEYCPTCFNGVVQRCTLCGKLVKRGMLGCDCEGAKMARHEAEEQKIIDAFDKAEIAPEEVEKACEFFYSDYYSQGDGYFSEWDDFFDDWDERIDEEDDLGIKANLRRPKYVWVTRAVEMSISADNIIENATQDLYEDAISDISDEKIAELQEFLDRWCKTCGVGTTYYESNKYKVRIPWEEYDERRKKNDEFSKSSNHAH